jgi:hypothetical protein
VGNLGNWFLRMMAINLSKWFLQESQQMVAVTSSSRGLLQGVPTGHHGPSKVSLAPAMPCPSTPCGQPAPLSSNDCQQKVSVTPCEQPPSVSGDFRDQADA